MSATSEESRASGSRTDYGGPAEPLGLTGHAALDTVHRELEAHTLEGHGAIEPLVKYRDAISGRYFRDRPIFTLAWPPSLYIPADADPAKYWISAPPDDHRFRYRWTDPQPTASTASEKTGQLFSWTNVSGLNPSYTGIAGVGVRIVPTNSLSTVRVSADVDVVAESRWWYLVSSSAGFSNFSYRGTVYIAGWEISPVTGLWELLRPFASRVLYQDRESGQGGSAIRSDHHAFDDLSVRLQLQGGHTYGIGVSFEVEVGFDCQDRSGRPYQKQPGDDIRLWASMVGEVSSITVSTETVWIS